MEGRFERDDMCMSAQFPLPTQFSHFRKVYSALSHTLGLYCNEKQGPDMTGLSTSRKLWEHPRPESTQLWKFKISLEKKIGHTFEVGILFYSTINPNLSQGILNCLYVASSS